MTSKPRDGRNATTSPYIPLVQPKTPHEEIMFVLESNNAMLSTMIEWAEMAKKAFEETIELMKKDRAKKK